MLQPDPEHPLLMWDKPPVPAYLNRLVGTPVARLNLSQPEGDVRSTVVRVDAGTELVFPVTLELLDRLLLVEMVQELAPVQ